MMNYDGFGWLMGGGLMMLPMLLIWIVPMALVVWTVSRLGPDRRSSTGDETPIEILRRRYASGEISLEEFERAGRALAGAGGQPQ